MLYVQVDGWDNKRLDAMSLDNGATHFGAVLRLSKTDPSLDSPCPQKDTKPEDLLFSTNQFEVKTTGNKTDDTPKPSLKFSLTKKDQRFLGMRALTFKSMWNDPSQMREYFAWRMLAKAGIPAGRHTYAKICMNSRYFGLYALLEDVDKPYLTDRFGKKGDDGNLYKANWKDLGAATLAFRAAPSGAPPGRAYWKAKDMGERTYELRTNDNDDDPEALKTYDDLATFIRTINGVDIPGTAPDKFDTPEYRLGVEAVFDVKGWLRWLGVNTLLGAWDNYWKTPGNYFLYNKGTDADFMAKPYFVWLPWDYDHSFGIRYAGQESWWHSEIVRIGNAKDNPLIANVLANREFLAYYLDFVEHFLDTHFKADEVEQSIKTTVWPLVETAAFLESKTKNCAPFRPTEDNRWRCAHTGRRFSNDAVYENARAFKWVDWDTAKNAPIPEFMRLREENVRKQLSEWRKTVPKGSSGATFP